MKKVTNKAVEKVMDAVIAEMEKGQIPWHKPWIAIGKQNLVSKKQYQGFNSLFLSLFADDENYFLTFNQAKKAGGHVRKGSHALPIGFYKVIDQEVKDESKAIRIIRRKFDGKEAEEKIQAWKNGNLKLTDQKFIYRYYQVFKLKDVDGVKRPEIRKNDNQTRETLEQFIAKQNANISHGGDSAYYRPLTDEIGIPEISRFDDTDHYYSTMFHELIHWTGSKKRTGRLENKNVYTMKEEYGKEELVAEIGAAILCNHFGINLPKHNASYLQNWLKTIKGNKEMLIHACSKAQKAIEYLGLMETEKAQAA